MEGRCLVVNIEHHSERFRLVNVYCPTRPKERVDFLLNLRNHLYGATNIILAGDFNFVENLSLDKVGGNLAVGDTGLREIKILKDDFALVEVFRHLFPSAAEVTWGNNLVFSRLDRFYVSRACLSQVQSIEHQYSTFSDHKLVRLVFRTPDEPQHGPSFWKCNVKILKDPNLMQEIKAIFDNDNSEITPLWWESKKRQIKQCLVCHSRQRARKMRVRECFLERQISEYEKCQLSLPGAFREEMSSLKAELHSLVAARLEGVMVRSRALIIRDLDRPSSFFFRRERQNRESKHIKSLVIGTRTIEG
jgi:hypothetical protein